MRPTSDARLRRRAVAVAMAIAGILVGGGRIPATAGAAPGDAVVVPLQITGPPFGAAEPGDHGRRLHRRRDAEVPRRRRPEPEHPVERRAVPHLPQLHQHVPASRSSRRTPASAATPTTGNHPRAQTRRCGCQLREHVVPPTRSRAASRTARRSCRAAAAQRSRETRPPASATLRCSGSQQHSRYLAKVPRRRSASLGRERPVARAAEHVHVRRHRRHAGDDLRRQPAGPTDLAARARPLARHARGRVSLLVA